MRGQGGLGACTELLRQTCEFQMCIADWSESISRFQNVGGEEWVVVGSIPPFFCFLCFSSPVYFLKPSHTLQRLTQVCKENRKWSHYNVEVVRAPEKCLSHCHLWLPISLIKTSAEFSSAHCREREREKGPHSGGHVLHISWF